MMQATHRIVVIDDHVLIRQAISNLLSEREDIKIVAEGVAGEDVIPLIEQYKPDILLLDINMPQANSSNNALGERFHALPTISWITKEYPETAIIILTQEISRTFIRTAIERGVKGYIWKGDDLLISLSNVVDIVQTGWPVFSQTVMQNLSQKPKDEISLLTEREVAVLSLITKYPDASTIEIANILNISPSTVKKHLTRTFAALEVKTKVSAILRCMELGILSPPNNLT